MKEEGDCCCAGYQISASGWLELTSVDTQCVIYFNQKCCFFLHITCSAGPAGNLLHDKHTEVKASSTEMYPRVKTQHKKHLENDLKKGIRYKQWQRNVVKRTKRVKSWNIYLPDCPVCVCVVRGPAQQTPPPSWSDRFLRRAAPDPAHPAARPMTAGPGPAPSPPYKEIYTSWTYTRDTLRDTHANSQLNPRSPSLSDYITRKSSDY